MVEFMIAVLAIWRVAFMFANEDGLLGFADKLRQLGIWLYAKRITTPYNVLTCVYCSSVWLGFAVGYLLHSDVWSDVIVYGLAYSTGAIILNHLHETYLTS